MTSIWFTPTTPLPDIASALEDACARFAGPEVQRDLHAARALRNVRTSYVIERGAIVIPPAPRPHRQPFDGPPLRGFDPAPAAFVHPDTWRAITEESESLRPYRDTTAESRLRRLEAARWADDGGLVPGVTR